MSTTVSKFYVASSIVSSLIPDSLRLRVSFYHLVLAKCLGYGSSHRPWRAGRPAPKAIAVGRSKNVNGHDNSSDSDYRPSPSPDSEPMRTTSDRSRYASTVVRRPRKLTSRGSSGVARLVSQFGHTRNQVRASSRMNPDQTRKKRTFAEAQLGSSNGLYGRRVTRSTYQDDLAVLVVLQLPSEKLALVAGARGSSVQVRKISYSSPSTCR